MTFEQSYRLNQNACSKHFLIVCTICILCNVGIDFLLDSTRQSELLYENSKNVPILVHLIYKTSVVIDKTLLFPLFFILHPFLYFFHTTKGDISFYLKTWNAQKCVHYFHFANEVQIVFKN